MVEFVQSFFLPCLTSFVSDCRTVATTLIMDICCHGNALCTSNVFGSLHSFIFGCSIGSSEKGWLTLDLSVKVKGGHSSMPEKESAIGILAEAILK